MITGALFAVALIGCSIATPATGSSRHAYVATALFPASALLCLVLGQIGPSLAAQLQAVGATVGGPIGGLLSDVRPLSNIGVVTLLDVECMTFFLLSCYGSMIVLRHLVDMVRILKVSRRRAVQWSS